MIKVFFTSNNALLDSPHFYYTFIYGPKGVKYISMKKEVSDVLLDMQKQRMLKFILNLGRGLLNSIGKSIVKENVVTKEIEDNIDLVHSFNTIPKTTKPFIVEMEAFHSLFVGGALDSSTVKRVIKLLSAKNCKRILFWTKNAHDNFHNIMMSPALKKKSIIIYPAVPYLEQNKRHKIPTIGFIARDFFNKGGESVLPVMENMVKAGRAKALIVTDLKLIEEKKPGTIEQYSKHIEFKQLMPRDELHKKIFPRIDVMLYPGYSDTFGYMFPESMSHGIPIVTFNGCARKEIVHNGLGGYVAWGEVTKAGFLKTHPIGEEIEKAQLNLAMCITNILTDWKKMSDYNYALVKDGQFSLKVRNKMLKQVYKEALI